MSRRIVLLGFLSALIVAVGVRATADAPHREKTDSLPKILILSGVPETHHDYKNQCPNMAQVLKD